MKAEATIRRMIRALQLAVDAPHTTQQSRDQCYAMAEALRWAVGDGPPVLDFIESEWVGL